VILEHLVSHCGLLSSSGMVKMQFISFSLSDLLSGFFKFLVSIVSFKSVKKKQLKKNCVPFQISDAKIIVMTVKELHQLVTNCSN